MDILSSIVVGLIAGWLAHRVLGDRGGVLSNLALGLVGAIVGGVLFTYLSPALRPGFFASLVTASVGAIIFLAVWRAIARS
jgi:uncharacterized membrane protein YeaQ/YmgE (transglycosylase-associated protein family)